ncbi:MAG: hypothetical protein P1U63_04405 [Coxiellaceae bacterium]|nr:hypothetical protein [Coxiellaceae bacterium]
MKLYIIDLRNRYLDSELSCINSNNPIVSVMLPCSDGALPGCIQTAIYTYLINNQDDEKSINVCVEVNDWIIKEQAINCLRNMNTLINRFYIQLGQLRPVCHLALFEEGEFSSVESIDNDVPSK